MDEIMRQVSDHFEIVGRQITKYPTLQYPITSDTGKAIVNTLKQLKDVKIADVYERDGMISVEVITRWEFKKNKDINLDVLLDILENRLDYEPTVTNGDHYSSCEKCHVEFDDENKRYRCRFCHVPCCYRCAKFGLEHMRLQCHEGFRKTYGKSDSYISDLLREARFNSEVNFEEWKQQMIYHTRKKLVLSSILTK